MISSKVGVACAFPRSLTREMCAVAAVGKFKLIKQLLSFVMRKQPIQLVLPAFPCKSPNTKLKVCVR
jgi:pyoverdine/dityrosine biosynthesis protein Dit1